MTEPGKVPPAGRQSAFREALAQPAGFATLVELVPWAGPMTDGAAARPLATAEALAGDRRVAALTVTDNAGGYVRLGPMTLARAITEMGADVVVHVSCRDRSRGSLTSYAWALASAGLTNILALSGDYPAEGYEGLSRPVFDIDSVALLDLLRSGSNERLDFCAGAAVNPFKSVERDLVPQMLKLAMKVRAGARFTITQVGYDVRSWDELLRWMRVGALDIPAIACVYILGLGAARAFHAGRVAGCAISDELFALVEAEAQGPDRGRARFLELAAMQVAVARGLGFRGVYLAGQRDASEIDRVLSMAAAFEPDWRAIAPQVHFPLPSAFRLFEDADEPILGAEDLSSTWQASRQPGRRGSAPLTYRFSRLVHGAVFDPGSAGFRAGRAFYERAEHWGLKRPLHVLEQVAKIPLFACRDCGDCSLPEIAYLCPESRCVKNQRNGPCGGSHAGECEVPGRPCIWASAYDRLKPYGEELSMLDRPPTVTDNALRHTSAWGNTFLGRDHAGQTTAAPAEGESKP